jgi:NAD-dependent dihydropyrimidine dehydrogenase PreA subunit
MPDGDQTGPRGPRPTRGRATDYGADFSGRGFRQGFGRRRRGGRWAGRPNAPAGRPVRIRMAAPGLLPAREELDRLNAQAAAIERQLASLRSGPTESRADRPRMAVVDRQRCTLCGVCVEICPADAITLNKTVAINLHACTGCGTCVERCPEQAISLT